VLVKKYISGIKIDLKYHWKIIKAGLVHIFNHLNKTNQFVKIISQSLNLVLPFISFFSQQSASHLVFYFSLSYMPGYQNPKNCHESKDYSNSHYDHPQIASLRSLASLGFTVKLELRQTWGAFWRGKIQSKHGDWQVMHVFKDD